MGQLALKPAWPPPLATLAAVLTITHASAVMPTLPSPARPLLVLSPAALLRRLRTPRASPPRSAPSSPLVDLQVDHPLPLPPPHPLLHLSPAPPALPPLLPPPWPRPWLHPCQVLPALLPALSPRLLPQLPPHQSRPPTLLPRRRLVASWPVLLSLLPSLCKR